MPKLSLGYLSAPRPGDSISDPACEGLRYRIRGSGRIYAELRHKDGPGKWTAHPLGRVNIADLIAEISDHSTKVADLSHSLRGRLAMGDRWRPVQPDQPTLDDVLEPVRQRARELRRALRRGEDPRARDSLGDAIEAHLRHARTKPRTARDRERYLRVDWGALHHRPIAAITRREVAEQLLRLREAKAGARGGGVAAANRSRAALSVLYRWAIKQGLCESNPVALTEVVPEQSRERVLDLRELRAIWQATAGPPLPAAYCGVVRLLMLTGARRGEVAALPWAEIDLDAALWRLPGVRSKNGQPNQIPLSAAAVDLLLETPDRGPYTFGGRRPYGTWAHTKVALDKLSGVSEWVLHDLRRSCATHMAEALGVEDRVIDAILNHVRRSKVTRTYIRAHHQAAKAQALERWAGFLLGDLPRSGDER
jgi:integrase